MWFQGFLRSRAFTHTSDPICLEKWHFSDKLTSVGGMIKNLEKYFHEKSFSFVSLKLYHHPKTTLGNTGFSTKLQKQVQILGEIGLFPSWGAISPYVRPKIWQIRSKTSHSDIWDARRLAISEKVIFLYARLLYHCVIMPHKRKKGLQLQSTINPSNTKGETVRGLTDAEEVAELVSLDLR